MVDVLLLCREHGPERVELAVRGRSRRRPRRPRRQPARPQKRQPGAAAAVRAARAAEATKRQQPTLGDAEERLDGKDLLTRSDPSLAAERLRSATSNCGRRGAPSVT